MMAIEDVVSLSEMDDIPASQKRLWVVSRHGNLLLDTIETTNSECISRFIRIHVGTVDPKTYWPHAKRHGCQCIQFRRVAALSTDKIEIQNEPEKEE